MYSYQAFVRNVVDGDTVDLDIDLGFRVTLRNVRCRLVGIDTPECRGAKKCQAGIDAKNLVTSELLNQTVRIRSYKDETVDVDSDSFGRWLVRIYLDGKDYNQGLIDRGYAQPFMTEKDNTLALNPAYIAALEDGGCS